MLYKAMVFGALCAAFSIYTVIESNRTIPTNVKDSIQQLNDGNMKTILMERHNENSLKYFLGWSSLIILGVIMFIGDVKRWIKAGLAGVVLFSTGCWRPFEPVNLQTITTNEVGFLLPYIGNLKDQAVTRNEEYLQNNLVLTQQVKIPQQWVPKGFETFGANGAWQDAAVLIKVDTSPVTREWTADPNSGTSSKNEAIWVMTSDQVEFSTGWTCTARISTREDAVKFLYNYPNGSIQTVMDTELRGKLQASFGLEVTDLPMRELRIKAAPHIKTVVDDVTLFFKQRGITITNLGITGGFVYKDPSIIKTLVEVFNAEQQKAVAAAATDAQVEKSKKVQLEAKAKAEALLTEKKAEADGIKLVADAKGYEIEKAKNDSAIYIALKQMELTKARLEKWDGKFPVYFMGATGNTPELLLQIPSPVELKK